ncbi:MAG: GNAT family N-acetyltransferase [Bacteroidota bacterium]|nr:MAG: GNAT family N-acetyltransferase [Bacteroidota bacterium]
MNYSIITLKSTDYKALKAILESNNLPFSDVGAEHQTFFGALNDKQLIGAIGVEKYGKSGLLRSLVVDHSFRSNQIASALYDELVEYCFYEKIEHLFLLTQTAIKYFERKGWQEINREKIPDKVKDSLEFSKLCPASATCMTINLLSAYAKKLFDSGFNCAQSSLLPFALRNGMKRETALSLATGFGAGMVYRGETCGTITGCMMAIGLFSGRTEAQDTDARDLTYMLINELNKKFSEKHGSINCRNLLQLNNTTASEWEKAEKDGSFETKCPFFVQDAVEITQGILAKYSKNVINS